MILCNFIIYSKEMIFIKRILMNKNVEVLVAEYDSATGVFTDIYDICNIRYSPYILNDLYDSNNFDKTSFRTNLSEWFKGRGIPSWRDKLDLLLHRLNIDYYDIEEMHISGEGKLFYEIKLFDEIIKVVKDIKRIDIDKLNDFPEWFDNLLHKYQYITGYSDTRINRLCILLNRQIEKLKEIIKNS